MTESVSSNKRIAKNTLILYMRMLFTVGISFYTTRLVLQSLGVSDYGLYGVVGSVVSMMYMITSAVSSGISRFLTFELGTGSKENLKKVFSSSVIILLGFSLLVILICETIGLWFLNNRLNVEAGRMVAANWVFQFSILTFVLEFMSIPYDASIISHERMKAFAFITILDVLVKFVIAVVIAQSPFDVLVYYAALMCANKVLQRMVYGIYCKHNFEECTFVWQFDKRVFNSIMTYSGWTLLSTIVGMVASTGMSFLVNIYYGTLVNAANSIASQIKGTLNAFTANFLKAINPQITKTYASGNHDRTVYLVYTSSKFAFILMYVVSLPVMYELNFVLGVWLKEVPPFASYFCVFVLLNTLVSTPLKAPEVLIGATGDVKNFHIYSSIAYGFTLPLGWLFLECGFNPYYTIIPHFVGTVLMFYPTVVLPNRYLAITWKGFMSNVIVPLSYVCVISNVVIFVICQVLEETWWRLILNCTLNLMIVVATTYLFVLTCQEKVQIRQIIRQRLLKYKD